ncbi:MAG: 3-oxoacyl-ACP synthase III family protein [bacterium]
MTQLKEVELVSTGVFLPGTPIPFDNLEDVLGSFNAAPPLVKRMEGKLRALAKELIGIEQVYYAIDKKTGEQTENNTTMAVKAVNNALEKANMKAGEVDCLLYGNLMADYQTPPTTTLIQEALGIEECAEIEVHSNCSGMSKMLQIALDALRLGRYKNVVIAYSQLSSAYLRSDYYNQNKLGVENILLRWFLCDSASALVLRASDKIKNGIKLEYADNLSIGGKKEMGMWLKLGTRNPDLKKAYEEGWHHFGQDYRAANDFGPSCFYRSFEKIVADNNFKYSDVDHILATLPSKKLWEYGKTTFLEKYGVTPDKWFGNVHRTGYAGASSVIIALNEMIKTEKFKPGELLTSIIFESSKWMIGGFVLRYL